MVVAEFGKMPNDWEHPRDFGDAFEREGDDRAYFLKFAPDGYAFGVNTIVYSMTH